MGYLWYLAPVAFWLFICFSGFVPLILLRFANFDLVEDAVPIFDKSLDTVNPVWLQQRGFRGVCGIKPLGISMAIYKSQDQKIAMAVYSAGGQRVVDFVSKFPGKISITTSSTIDGPVAPPPPGVMYQCFKGRDPDDLLRLHLQGVTYLQSQMQIAVEPHKDIAKEMEQFMGRQLKHLLTRPWHILTIPYRYGVLRFTRMNKTVEQQVQKRIIKVDKLKRQAQSIQGRAKAGKAA